MQKYKQLYRHNPPESYGDCFRTCLGCLLDMPPETVPHFYDGCGQDDDATEANEAIRYWLFQQGYVMVQFAYECPLEQVQHFMSVSNPTVYYLITGKSVTGNNHVCVGLAGDIIWDPAPEGKGLVGLNSHGQHLIELLVPVSQSSGWLSRQQIEERTRSETSSPPTPEQP